MRKIYTLIILAAGISGQTFAHPPECPLFKNKQDCMHSVQSTYEKSLKFIDENTSEEDLLVKDKMLEASLDIKKYESLACQKTCLH
jgi:hypothetical protein